VIQLAASIALSHHERFDGAGYPAGTAGRDIPVEGRIAAVADVFDALTSDRVYRSALPVEEALEMIDEGSGSQFDPQVAQALLESVDEVAQIRRDHSERAAA
jgi:putative two-component system response regulator